MAIGPRPAELTGLDKDEWRFVNSMAAAFSTPEAFDDTAWGCRAAATPGRCGRQSVTLKALHKPCVTSYRNLDDALHALKGEG